MYGGDAIESDGQEDDAEITQVCTHLTSSLPGTLLFVLSVQATLLKYVLKHRISPQHLNAHL